MNTARRRSVACRWLTPVTFQGQEVRGGRIKLRNYHLNDGIKDSEMGAVCLTRDVY
jgi:hypothetical protein